MANRIVSSPYWDSESTPTIHQILHASEEVWRELALLADADPIYCERLRARLQTQTPSPKPKRRSRRQRKPTRTPRRNWRAANLLRRQFALATLEALDRVDDRAAGVADEPPAPPTVLITPPDLVT
jgi:hypothetical protein